MWVLSAMWVLSIMYTVGITLLDPSSVLFMQVVKGNENLVNTGFGRALILTSDLIVSGTTCEFKGCYGKYTSGYFLMEDIQPCYIGTSDSSVAFRQ